MQPIDLNPHDLEIVLAILQKVVPDREVWAFGSRVKWTAKPFSDLDLAVIGEQPLPAGVVADLAETFDESELPIKVDVVDWATTSEAFRQIIEKEKVVVQHGSKRSAVSPAPTFAEQAGGLSSVALLCIVQRTAWSYLPLDEVAQVVDCPHTTPQIADTGPYIARSQDVRSGFFLLGEAAHVSEETYLQRISRTQPQYGDVLYSREGTYFGIAAEIPKGIKVCLGQRMVLIRPAKEILDHRFLRLWLNSPLMVELVRGQRDGSVAERLNVSTIRNLPVLLPPLTAQRKIADILSSIEEKSDINRRHDELLKLMAKAVFQSWMIDFDPVRDKAEGRALFGLDNVTAALFPSTFESTELGEIPSGWAATTLAAIVTERTGKIGNGNEHVVLSAVASGELKRSAEHFTKQVHSQDTSKYKRVGQWDYAYNPSRINIGSIGMLEEPIVGAVSPVYTVLRPSQGYEWFLRFFLDLPQTKEVINQFCSGSVRQSLSFKDFAAIPVVLPPKEIAEAFARRWEELNGLCQHLEIESNKLAEVRDTLLPKLMSGELRVPDELMV